MLVLLKLLKTAKLLLYVFECILPISLFSAFLYLIQVSQIYIIFILFLIVSSGFGMFNGYLFCWIAFLTYLERNNHL